MKTWNQIKYRRITISFIYSILLINLLFVSSCKKKEDSDDIVNANSYTDPRDGNVYKTVTIGNQVWMAENLRYLPSVVPPSTISDSLPYCYVWDYYGHDVNEAKATSNYLTYGVLYNWPAAMGGAQSSNGNPSGVQGICPPGWHLPSEAEWTELFDYLGGINIAGGKLKETDTIHWLSPNTGATNETGFNALPGGVLYANGVFYGYKVKGSWWCSKEYNENLARFIEIGSYLGGVNNSHIDKESGASVRCIKD